jgi:hypothetical protein
MRFPILRVARPTDDIDALLPFYEQGLGLTVLCRFEDHDGFDGVMLGHERRPGISSSPTPAVTPPAARRPRTTCWSSTCPMPPSGETPSTGCAAPASRRFRPSIPTGTVTA